MVEDDTDDCIMGYKNENASWDFLEPILFILQTQRSEECCGLGRREKSVRKKRNCVKNK